MRGVLWQAWQGAVFRAQSGAARGRRSRCQLCRTGQSQSRQGEGEEEVLLMRRGQTAEEALSEGCKKGATVDLRCCIGMD